jgi:predicted nuclease with TOPRIM domain
MPFNFEIPKIFKSIHLSDYAPEFGEEAVIEVWVNFPRALLIERNTILAGVEKNDKELEEVRKENPPDQERIDVLQKESIDLQDQFNDWLAKVWHQKGTPISKEEITAMFEQADITDPKLMEWLFVRTFALILEHREARKN